MRTYLHYPQHFFTAILLLVAVSSCRKTDVPVPDFTVTTPKTTYAVNEPITFSFTGDAHIVSFFSGLPGSEYKYKDRLTVNGKPQMQFTSYFQASTQANTLRLMVSKDFSGVFDIPNFQNATWIDITSRATLSTGVDNTPSGVVDLSDFLEDNSPVYIAFKYAAASTSAQPTWTIKNIAIDNVDAEGNKVSIATSANLVWGAINILNSANNWTYSATQVQFSTSAAGNADNEDWLITQPLQLNRVQRAVGISIKPGPTTVLTSYVFAGYSKPGTYVASFEAINANRYRKESTLKEMTIVVQ